MLCPFRKLRGLEYASVNPGVGHHCGHDGHMAIALWTRSAYACHRRIARLYFHCYFSRLRETGQGAAAMLRDEAMKDWHPSRIIALHNHSGTSSGDNLSAGKGVMLVAPQQVFQSAFRAPPPMRRIRSWEKSPWRALQTLADQGPAKWPSTLVPLWEFGQS